MQIAREFCFTNKMTSGRFQLNGSSSDNDSEHRNCDVTNSTVAEATSDDDDSSRTAATAEEHIRKFLFSGINPSNNTSESLEKIEIKIPELLQGGYSFYTWPCAPVLAWFLWEQRHALVGKRVLELGAGTALPGILLAKCGAQVILTDNCILSKSLAHLRKCCLANNLQPGIDIEVQGLSWGLLLHSVFHLQGLDLIIAADCFYDPSVFEDIIVTVSFLLERNPQAKFLFTYQERSADWSIEALLKKWKLCALPVNIDDVGKSSGVDLLDFMGGHTIHLLEVCRQITQ